MAQEWDIKSRSEACKVCEKPFLDKQEYFATLAHSSEGYCRKDYCLDCWAMDKEKTDAYYSTWKGVFKMPPPPEEEAFQKETAESLLRKMMEDDDASKINARYILAVMLERKRILIERDVQVGRDGGKVRIYEHRQTGETFVIPDPALRLDELDEVQEEVVVMLGGKVPEGKGSNSREDADLSDPEQLRKHIDENLTDDDGDDDDEYDDDDEDDE